MDHHAFSLASSSSAPSTTNAPRRQRYQALRVEPPRAVEADGGGYGGYSAVNAEPQRERRTHRKRATWENADADDDADLLAAAMSFAGIDEPPALERADRRARVGAESALLLLEDALRLLPTQATVMYMPEVRGGVRASVQLMVPFCGGPSLKAFVFAEYAERCGEYRLYTQLSDRPDRPRLLQAPHTGLRDAREAARRIDALYQHQRAAARGGAS